MILMVLPEHDYDPTESSVPWQALRKIGQKVVFATPDGRPSKVDTRLTETGFGLLSPFLMTKCGALKTHSEMERDENFNRPLSYDDVDVSEIDGLLVPGGHAPGMKTMLESKCIQDKVVSFFEANKPVAAVCHGVLLLARSISSSTGKSVLYGRKTTCLTKRLELSGWAMTALWLKNYYRTYPVTVQEEVMAVLERKSDFIHGPLFPKRDSEQHLERGFTVRDGNYISARWPGDCYRFGKEFAELVSRAAG